MEPPNAACSNLDSGSALGLWVHGLDVAHGRSRWQVPNLSVDLACDVHRDDEINGVEVPGFLFAPEHRRLHEVEHLLRAQTKSVAHCAKNERLQEVVVAPLLAG
jgi:hypothetical protein